MHIWWRTMASGGYSSWTRMKYKTGTAFTISVSNITPVTQALPRIIEFSHKYGSVIKPTDQLWFSFATSSSGYPNVVPSNNPYDTNINGIFQGKSWWIYKLLTKISIIFLR